MTSDEKKNASIAPIINPDITSGFATSITLKPAFLINALNRAIDVIAADPIANPFSIAAVVFPTESNLSVISRTLLSNPLISAIPPALSAIGP